jgi:phage baseplate assembly protein W
MATETKIKQYVDLDLSFQINPFTKDLYLKTDEDAVKTSIKHLMRTNNFERPFHPEIGTQIRSLMFEHFSSAVRIAMERTIRESIEKFEPRARILDVTVEEYEDSNDLAITIVFALKNGSTPITITTSISRVR